MTNETDESSCKPRTEKLRHEESGITIVSNFLGDKLEGEQKTFGPDEQLMQSLFFKDGEMEGKLQLFEQGTLRTEQQYHQGKLHGESSYFDAEGNRIGSVQYAEGELHGFSEWKSSDGKLLSRGNHQQGKLHGKQLEFYANGKLRKRVSYDKGEVQGDVEYFEANGLPSNASRVRRMTHPLTSLLHRKPQAEEM